MTRTTGGKVSLSLRDWLGIIGVAIILTGGLISIKVDIAALQVQVVHAQAMQSGLEHRIEKLEDRAR